jgi:TonB family protein
LFPRYNLAVPVDITVLRSGVPDTIPGRSLNLSESGLGAVLAGELAPGQSVGIELVLPRTGLPVHLKALVRHQEQLHCGVEFVALTAEQRGILHAWAKRIAAESPSQTPPAVAAQEGKENAEQLVKPIAEPVRVSGYRKKLLALAIVIVFLAGGAVWWHWERSWRELENHLMGAVVLPRGERLHVPAEIMQQRIVHKVDPLYPDDAREGNIQGVVVMQVSIGRDGNVISVRPISGPEVLTPAATEAVRWWQFEPYLEKGRAVEVETTLGVEFHP